MNTPIEIRVEAKRPLPAPEPIELLSPQPLPNPEAQRAPEPSETAAYGCVEWFNYQRHRLRQPPRREV